MNKQHKRQYRNQYNETFEIGNIYSITYTRYPNARDHTFRRKLRSKQEKTMYIAHYDEYVKNSEYKVRLRARRSSRNLTCCRSDKRSSLYSSAKSWKTSTKRKSQYYK